MSKTSMTSPAAYSAQAVLFHWLTVVLVAVLGVTGWIATERAEKDIWDAITNNLYSTHKLLGFILLWLVVWRLTYRARKGAPDHEPSLSSPQRIASTAVHWGLYGLLLAVPMVGWLGISMYPALEIFGLFSLPSLTGKSDAAEKVLNVHHLLAWLLLAVATLHILAALYHYFVRRDGVMARMLPGARAR